ncbi:MAG: hypothetical protein IPM82_03980 [Saprospiraceae bacterium]|nr:hypothetical protein [Saprospiraceae bacterium]
MHRIPSSFISPRRTVATASSAYRWSFGKNYEIMETAVICSGATYSFNGQQLNQPGNYTDTLATVHGCDSTVVLSLEVVDSIEVAFAASICEGQSYPFNNELLTQSGTYTANYTAMGGCDSTVTLTLTVLPIATGTQVLSICEGDTIHINGEEISGADTLIYVITNGSLNGCDSIVTTIVDVLPVASSAFDYTICEGDTYDFNGQILTDAGVYQTVYSSANGCDSTVTLTLMVLPVATETQVLTICDGEIIIIDGQVVSEADTFIYVLTASNGCDSIVSLIVDVLPASVTFLQDTICQGDIYNFNGHHHQRWHLPYHLYSSQRLRQHRDAHVGSFTNPCHFGNIGSGAGLYLQWCGY